MHDVEGFLQGPDALPHWPRCAVAGVMGGYSRSALITRGEDGDLVLPARG